MNKIWLIIKREYLTRVKKKTFILSTFLTPLLFAGVIFVVILITVKSTSQEKIAVKDASGFYKNKLHSTKSVQFDFESEVDSNDYHKKGYTGILYTPKSVEKPGGDFLLITRKNLSIVSEDRIEDQITSAIENYMLDSMYKIDLNALEAVRKQARSARIDNRIKKDNETVERGNSGIAYAVGYAAAFLIYITLFVYGAMVMRGVMEEKTNRIAEVMVSSVKPFQLMIGKIIGIGAVGLTQFFMWIVLVTIFMAVINSFIPPEVMAQVQQGGTPMAGNAVQASQTVKNMAEFSSGFSSVNWFLIVGCFLFYFLFGYLFYAALFAAVGSAVNEDPQDAQSLMFPITMPIVLAIIIMVNAITNPTSPMAVWSSIIPFFSPVVMMARLPFGVPGTVAWWELGLSMLFLVAGFLFTTWLSANIYRTGILLYGKKVTWKEMMKWAFRKA